MGSEPDRRLWRPESDCAGDVPDGDEVQAALNRVRKDGAGGDARLSHLAQVPHFKRL